MLRSIWIAEKAGTAGGDANRPQTLRRCVTGSVEDVAGGFKSELQEYVQKRFGVLVTYELMHRPDRSLQEFEMATGRTESVVVEQVKQNKRVSEQPSKRSKPSFTEASSAS